MRVTRYLYPIMIPFYVPSLCLFQDRNLAQNRVTLAPSDRLSLPTTSHAPLAYQLAIIIVVIFLYPTTTHFLLRSIYFPALCHPLHRASCQCLRSRQVPNVPLMPRLNNIINDLEVPLIRYPNYYPLHTQKLRRIKSLLVGSKLVMYFRKNTFISAKSVTV